MLKQALALALSLALSLPTVKACTCIGQENVKQARKRADVVVLGKVIRGERLVITIADDTLLTSVVMRYAIIVERSFKGRIRGDTMIVYTGSGDGDCGYEFEAGQRYLIYGDRDPHYSLKRTASTSLYGKNIIWTDICTRTRPYDESEVKALGD
jgi:hypothetical protein